VFKLFDAFQKVLLRANQQADHQVLFERLSITDRIVQLTELLADRRRMSFEQLLLPEGDGTQSVVVSRFDLVLTFLALLEMCKMRVARITQDDPLGDLFVEFAAKRLAGDDVPSAAEAEPAKDDAETDQT
jgi:segregation and condensation protein A